MVSMGQGCAEAKLNNFGSKFLMRLQSRCNRLQSSVGFIGARRSATQEGLFTQLWLKASLF